MNGYVVESDISAVKSSSLCMYKQLKWPLLQPGFGCFEIRHGSSQRNFDFNTTSYNLGICAENR